jgi:hypothetical protein
MHEQCYQQGVASTLELTRPKQAVLCLQNLSKEDKQ